MTKKKSPKKASRSNKKPKAAPVKNCLCLSCGKKYVGTFKFGVCKTCKAKEVFRNDAYDVEHTVCYS